MDYMQEYEYYKIAWEKAVSERTKLRDERIVALEAEIAILEKENARYREALIEISKPDPMFIGGPEAYRYKTIAREALKGEDK